MKKNFLQMQKVEFVLEDKFLSSKEFCKCGEYNNSSICSLCNTTDVLKDTGLEIETLFSLYEELLELLDNYHHSLSFLKYKNKKGDEFFTPISAVTLHKSKVTRFFEIITRLSSFNIIQRITPHKCGKLNDIKELLLIFFKYIKNKNSFFIVNFIGGKIEFKMNKNLNSINPNGFYIERILKYNVLDSLDLLKYLFSSGKLNPEILGEEFFTILFLN